MKKVLLLIMMAFLFIAVSNTVNAKSLNHKKAYTIPKQTFKLKVKGAKKVKWYSNKPSVATVKKGKVKTHKKGSVKITAKVGKKKYTCKVKIYSKAKMKKRFYKTYDKLYRIDKHLQGHETKEAAQKSLIMCKKEIKCDYSFYNNLVGKKQQGFRKACLRFRKTVKRGAKLEKAIIKLYSEKGENIKDTEEYKKIDMKFWALNIDSENAWNDIYDEYSNYYKYKIIKIS